MRRARVALAQIISVILAFARWYGRRLLELPFALTWALLGGLSVGFFVTVATAASVAGH